MYPQYIYLSVISITYRHVYVRIYSGIPQKHTPTARQVMNVDTIVRANPQYTQSLLLLASAGPARVHFIEWTPDPLVE